MNKVISSLVNYYLAENYIEKQDTIYCTNRIAAILKIDVVIYDKNVKGSLYDSLENLIDYAVNCNLIADYVYEKEILEASITNVFIAKPSEVQKEFESKDIVDAYKDFYKQSVDVNYIKLKQLEKNIHYKSIIEDKPIEISINLAKPEKDPKEIAMLKDVQSTAYPKCLLCEENVGYVGSIKHPARENHRVIELDLNNEKWMFQYSPYSYYDYHSILIEKQHQDMEMNDNTIKVQLDFVDKFTNFFVGNNATLPIVGGSILNHNHFQSGIYNFPIERSNSIFKMIDGEVEVEYLDWYLTTIKLTSTSKDDITRVANNIRKSWKSFDNQNLLGKNNCLNYITRKTDDVYEVLVILRNNLTTEEFSNGVYHPSSNYFHLKKENIGLIEAMGLAILPARLVSELEDVKSYLVDGKNIEFSKHFEWAKYLKTIYNGENVDEFINREVAKRFVEILKCCDVLKYVENKEEVIKMVVEGSE